MMMASSADHQGVENISIMSRSLWCKKGAMVLLSESVNDPMPDKPEALNTLGFVYDDLSKVH
jgi:hypothetical protein